MWFLMTDKEDMQTFTYVYNSGVVVETFLEAIPQIVIMNINTWHFGDSGGFVFWFGLC